METKKKQLVISGIGEILWDMLPDGKQLGGAPANFVYHAQALGGKGYLVSCVGNDEFGQEILDCLHNLGIDCYYIAVNKEHPTGTVSVDLDAKGNPHYFIHKNAAWDFIHTSPALYELAAKTDAVYFGSLSQRSNVSRSTIHKFLEKTKKDCIIAFDINLRQPYYTKDIILYSLKQSNILKLNIEELSILSDMLSISGSETDILSHLINKYSLSLIALTKGRHGSRLFAPENESVHPGFQVKVEDTVGAGDAFAAALVMGKLFGYELDHINKEANRLASFVCTKKGACPEIPLSIVHSFNSSISIKYKNSPYPRWIKKCKKGGRFK